MTVSECLKLGHLYEDVRQVPRGHPKMQLAAEESELCGYKPVPTVRWVPHTIMLRAGLTTILPTPPGHTRVSQLLSWTHPRISTVVVAADEKYLHCVRQIPRAASQFVTSAILA